MYENVNSLSYYLINAAELYSQFKFTITRVFTLLRWDLNITFHSFLIQYSRLLEVLLYLCEFLLRPHNNTFCHNTCLLTVYKQSTLLLLRLSFAYIPHCISTHKATQKDDILVSARTALNIEIMYKHTIM
jgi:hypothetical protein